MIALVCLSATLQSALDLSYLLYAVIYTIADATYVVCMQRQGSDPPNDVAGKEVRAVDWMG